MFHAQDGLSFARLEDGSVQVILDGIIVTALSPDTWASVCASMSLYGDTVQAWSEAKAFHWAGQEPDEV